MGIYLTGCANTRSGRELMAGLMGENTYRKLMNIFAHARSGLKAIGQRSGENGRSEQAK